MSVGDGDGDWGWAPVPKMKEYLIYNIILT